MKKLLNMLIFVAIACPLAVNAMHTAPRPTTPTGQTITRQTTIENESLKQAPKKDATKFANKKTWNNPKSFDKPLFQK